MISFTRHADKYTSEAFVTYKYVENMYVRAIKVLEWSMWHAAYFSQMQQQWQLKSVSFVEHPAALLRLFMPQTKGQLCCDAQQLFNHWYCLLVSSKQANTFNTFLWGSSNNSEAAVDEVTNALLN